MPHRILVLHGPNLNLLGTREPEVYGRTTLADIDAALLAQAKAAGAEVATFQSNHEGALVDRIQAARAESIDFIVINPAAYTHTSIAILDAIKSIKVPVIEVHISDPAMREEFRHVSFVEMGAVATVKGMGARGYVMALEKVAEL